VIFASGAGVQVSGALQWKEPACRVGVPLAFGCAIAPFLAGFAIMAPMAIWQGASHGSHLAVAGVLLLAAYLMAKFFQKPQAAKFMESNGATRAYMLGAKFGIAPTM
jgi:hypothetical protein